MRDDPMTLINDGTAEDQMIAAAEVACPHCGGSGHKDDVKEPEPGIVDAMFIGTVNALIARLDAGDPTAMSHAARNMERMLREDAYWRGQLAIGAEQWRQFRARAVKAEKALTDVRAAIMEADPAVLVCTLWMPDRLSPCETVVDHIDAALPPKGGSHAR